MTEIHVISTDQMNRTFRQVGWQGFTGRFYAIGDDPSPTEPGGFSPIWILAHSEPVVGIEVIALPAADDVTL